MNKDTHKFVLRPVRVIVYLILLALDIFMIYFMRNYFWQLIAAILVLAPWISFLGLWWVSSCLEIELGAGNRYCDAGDVVPLEIRMKNPAYCPILDSRIRFRIGNSFFENESDITLSMPIRMHGVSFLRVPLEFRDQGRFVIAIQGCVFQDLLGLVECRWKVRQECEIFSLPDRNPEEEDLTEQYLSGAAETEESKEKGNDFSEVSDIREYIPGDRIRDIHWKLTAKQDALMVKERVAVAGSEMVLVLSLSSEKYECEQILSSAYSIAASMVAKRMPVCLICWNRVGYCFDEYRCGSEDEIRQAFCELFRIPVRDRLDEHQSIYMKNFYPHLKSYLSIQREDGKVQVEMRENV